MSLTFVNEIPASTRPAVRGKWAKVAEQLRENPGKVAIVAELPFETPEEKKRMTERAGGISSRLRAYGAQGTMRTASDEGVIRVYGQAV